MNILGLRGIALITSVSLSSLAHGQEASLAHAQEASAGTAQQTAAAGAQAQGADNAGIGDIVVTAQRRAESAQSVPISLQSFSSDALEQRAVKSTEDLTSVIGGLIVQPSGARPTPFLRGVGTNSTSTTPAVLTFVDGVYRPFGQSTDLDNVERIEVLKGPQGTLFGRNATGGVIQIVTKPPSETPGGRFEVGYGNYETVNTSAYLTGGLGTGVAMDVSVHYSNQNEGFGINVFNGDELYRTRKITARSRLRAELSDVTNVTLAGDYMKINQNLGGAIVPAAGYDYLFVDGALRRLGDSYFPRKYSMNGGTTTPFANAEEWAASLTIESQLGGVSVRSITAYIRGMEDILIDSDIGPADSVELIVRRDPRTSFTQEFLLSGGSAPFEWVAGAFYYRGTASISPFAFYGIGAEALFGLLPGRRIEVFANDLTESIAGFAQGTYEIAPGTKLTLGGRYTVEKRQISGTVFRNGAELTERAGTLSSKIKEPTWRVALDHKFNDDVMIYGSISRGFNSGFFNQSSTAGFASTAANPKVDPEFLTAYEIGTKTDLLDGHLRVNASAFKYDYKGLQQQVLEFGSTKTINAGSAEIEGIELEVIARPVPPLTLSVSGTYLDAKYKSYALAPNVVRRPNGSIATEGSRDAAGRTMANTPELSYTTSATHVLPTSAGTLTTSANVNYRGKTFVDPQNRFKLPTRYVVNVTERWTSPDDTLFLTLWVKNLFDKHYDYAATVLSPAGIVGGPAAPRTYGISAGYKF